MEASRPNQTPLVNDPSRQYRADYERDQLRYAPHIVFLKAYERLDEVMASQDPRADPYGALKALYSGLFDFARTDPEFQRDALIAFAIEDEWFAQYGGMPVLEYVALWKSVLVGVMRRAGMFKPSSLASTSQEPSAGGPPKRDPRNLDRLNSTSHVEGEGA